jgi:hypothetical protein
LWGYRKFYFFNSPGVGGKKKSVCCCFRYLRIAKILCLLIMFDTQIRVSSRHKFLLMKILGLGIKKFGLSPKSDTIKIFMGSYEIFFFMKKSERTKLKLGLQV